MTINKRNILITLIAGYMYLLGLVLIGHTVYPRIDKGIKRNLYRQVQLRLNELEQILERNRFSDHDSLEFFDEHRSDLLVLMRRFKRTQMGRTPILVVGIVAVAVLAGLLFMISGTALIRHSPRTRKAFVWAYCIYGIYFALYVLNGYFEIQFLDRTSVELWQLSSLFEPDMGELRYVPLVKSLSNFAVTRLAVFAVVNTFIGVIIPLYGLTRPALRPVGDQQR